MILHVLHFRFRDDASDADKDAWIAQARRMEKATALCVVGQKIGGQEGFTHTYCVAYDDIRGMERYLAEPGHHELVARFAELVEEFTTVDFSDDMDPTLGATLWTMLGEWMAPKPELAAKLEAIQT